jgi:hypothetical protein
VGRASDCAQQRRMKDGAPLFATEAQGSRERAGCDARPQSLLEWHA